ncbi:uncharacterized protein LOC6589585 [Drosophila persimilis]|uniref:uncharacterized protein LOC6589585 n=1 Tax=Drosophila persimilis TaxID=7234 RepID=UPI000F077C3A|nr:uncharacterized protein LOC6589585 [Drosophila persimilis]
MGSYRNTYLTMSHLRFQLFVLYSFCFHSSLHQLVPVPDSDLMAGNELLMASAEDDLEWTQANWQLVIPWLLQLQQVRLCVAVSIFDQQLVYGTPCAGLLAQGPLMASCDIGHIEDLSVTMRDAFGPMLFDTMQKCRPGLELFGVRCRRRA